MITPQIENQMQPTTQLVELPSKTYKITETRIGGFVDGLEAVKQAVYHILSVERYSCAIYNDNYGVEFEQYIGQDLEFIEATLEDTLKEALTQDLRILDVELINIEKTNIDTLLIDFNVISIHGNIQMEVEINV